MPSLRDLDGTHWTGTKELWLDPLGNEVIRSECSIDVSVRIVRYGWSHEGEAHQGAISVHDDGTADFRDSWHQPEPMRCLPLAHARGLIQVEGRYGPEGDWGWRIGLTRRDVTDELVLQMTNIAPWGEEVRAVRMICRPG